MSEFAAWLFASPAIRCIGHERSLRVESSRSFENRQSQ